MELPVPRFKVFNSFVIHNLLANAHLNRDKIESNLSVPGFQGCHENALYKSFDTSPHLICLYASHRWPHLSPTAKKTLPNGTPVA